MTVNEDGDIVCIHCKRPFPTREEYLAHRQMPCVDVQPIEVPVKKKPWVLDPIEIGGMMMPPKDEPEPEPEAEPEPEKHECHICGKVFDSRPSLGSHKRYHTLRKKKKAIKKEAEPATLEETTAEPKKGMYFRFCSTCKVVYRINVKDFWKCYKCGGELTSNWRTVNVSIDLGEVEE